MGEHAGYAQQATSVASGGPGNSAPNAQHGAQLSGAGLPRDQQQQHATNHDPPKSPARQANSGVSTSATNKQHHTPKDKDAAPKVKARRTRRLFTPHSIPQPNGTVETPFHIFLASTTVKHREDSLQPSNQHAFAVPVHLQRDSPFPPNGSPILPGQHPYTSPSGQPHLIDPNLKAPAGMLMSTNGSPEMAGNGMELLYGQTRAVNMMGGANGAQYLRYGRGTKFIAYKSPPPTASSKSPSLNGSHSRQQNRPSTAKSAATPATCHDPPDQSQSSAQKPQVETHPSSHQKRDESSSSQSPVTQTTTPTNARAPRFPWDSPSSQTTTLGKRKLDSITTSDQSDDAAQKPFTPEVVPTISEPTPKSATPKSSSPSETAQEAKPLQSRASSPKDSASIPASPKSSSSELASPKIPSSTPASPESPSSKPASPKSPPSKSTLPKSPQSDSVLPESVSLKTHVTTNHVTVNGTTPVDSPMAVENPSPLTNGHVLSPLDSIVIDEMNDEPSTSSSPSLANGVLHTPPPIFRSAQRAEIFKRPKLDSSTFDSNAFDAQIYAQADVLDPPEGVQIPGASENGTKEDRLYLQRNPLIHGMHDRSEKWYQEKLRERQPGERKFWFGKVIERQRWLKSRKAKASAPERGGPSAEMFKRKDPEPWSHQRPMDFGDVPEDELPSYVKENPAWVNFCGRLRDEKTKIGQLDATMQRDERSKRRQQEIDHLSLTNKEAAQKQLASEFLRQTEEFYNSVKKG